MRLLHTSDWHLGRTLHGFPLRDAQGAAVDDIVDLAVARGVHAVIVAGDIFDRAVPPVESIRLLNSALERLADAGIVAIVSSGNHDSGERLATYSGLLRESVRIVGSVADVGTPVCLEDVHGALLVYALPYLEPDSARHELGPEGAPLERSHAAVIAEALDRVSADLAGRNGPRTIVVGHAFVADVRAGPRSAASEPAVDADVAALEAMTSASERDLTVGGVQVVPAELFAGRGLAYVALGHLHRPQVVREANPRIAYSGSLLRYSLSEAGQDKSVIVVDVGAPGSPVDIEVVPVAQPRGMARLSGSMDELLSPAFAEHRESFVELAVTDPDYPERMHSRLDEAFPFALVKVHRPASTPQGEAGHRGDARGRDPVGVLAGFFRKVTERDLSPVQADVLRRTYETVREGGS